MAFILTGIQPVSAPNGGYKRILSYSPGYRK